MTSKNRHHARQRRFAWLKRLALLGLMVLVLITAVRLIWGQRMHARLDAAINDIQSRGEPIRYADLRNEPLTNQDNGAWYLSQALQNWPSVPGQPGVNVHDTDWYLEGEDAGFTDPITDNPGYLASCEPVFDLIRQGVAQDCSRWFAGPIPSDFNTFQNVAFNHLGDTRRLARLMDDAARRAFEADDPARCFDLVRLIGEHGDQVGSQRLSVIDVLVMVSIHAMTYDYANEHLVRLTDEQVRRPETRAALIAMRDWLADESTAREHYLQSLIANRWSTHQYLLGLRDGSIPPNKFTGYGFGRLITDTPGLAFALRPLIDHAHAEALELETDSIGLFITTDNLYDLSDDGGEPTFEERYEARPWLYPMFEEMFFSDAVYRTYYRQLATRRMTAAAIAIRLYQADQGTRPGSLNQLVPEYLAKVPMDPYVGDRAIGYRPLGVVPKTQYEAGREYSQPVSDEVRAKLPRDPIPMLYCVGIDFDDNGGLLVIDERDGTLYDHRWGDVGEDHWLLLVPELEPAQELIDLDNRAYELQFDDDAWADPSDRGEDEVEEQRDAWQNPEDQEPQPEPGD